MNQRTVRFAVADMSCANCAQTVGDGIESLDCETQSVSIKMDRCLDAVLGNAEVHMIDSCNVHIPTFGPGSQKHTMHSECRLAKPHQP